MSAHFDTNLNSLVHNIYYTVKFDNNKHPYNLIYIIETKRKANFSMCNYYNYFTSDMMSLGKLRVIYCDLEQSLS
jgi:hypothetical protein